jgi:CRISPR-associated protein Csd2
MSGAELSKDTHTDPSKRHEFVLLFDVTDGNPNGDPDMGNMPRVDRETMHGLVTDVAMKRKIRDFVALTQHQNGKVKDGFDIFIQSKTALNTLYFRALREAGIEAPKVTINDDGELVEWLTQLQADDWEFDPENLTLTYTGEAKKQKDILKALIGDDEIEASVSDKLKLIARKLADVLGGNSKITRGKRDETKSILCRQYFDIRMFGAVLTAGTNAGQVRGPVQLTFARSIDPVLPYEATITRVAITRESDRRRKQTEMGRKPSIPYGLYRAQGYFNPFLAKQTGVTQTDLEVFWTALAKMLDYDHSAARKMSMRKLIIFTHKDALGNAPAHRLFEAVQVKRKTNGKAAQLEDAQEPGASPARSYADYTVEIDGAKLPEGIEVLELL